MTCACRKEPVEIRCLEFPEGIVWEARHMYVDLPAVHGFFEDFKEVVVACLKSGYHISIINEEPRKIDSSKAGY
jgi:hypothetical protein